MTIITRGMSFFLRSLNRTIKRLFAARNPPATPTFTVPLPSPAAGMFYDTPQRSVMINKLIKDIRYLRHPAEFPFPEETCNTCDTQVLRQTLEGYSDELLHALISHHMGKGRGNGTLLSAHDGKDEAYVRTFFSILFSAELERMFEEVGRSRNFLFRHAAASVALYENLPYEDSRDYYRKASALTGAVLAIMRVARETGVSPTEGEVPLLTYYNDNYVALARITSDALAEFICEHPDEWEQIAEIAAYRKTSDPYIISAVLNSAMSILRSGLL